MKFNFSHVINYKTLTQDHLNHFDTGCISYIIDAVQKENTPKPNIVGMTTRELRIMRENESREMSFKHDYKHKAADMDPNHIKLELSLLQKKFDIIEDRENQLHKLCNSYAKQKLTKEVQQFLNEVVRILNSKPKK
jgi:hypothetical protein